MRLAILGATGSVGRILVRRALEAGHEVTAIARQPETLAPHPRLTLVKADVMRSESLKTALKASVKVICRSRPSKN